MRLILIAHGLINRTGHHYMEARSFKDEAAKRGLGCTILAHRDIDLVIREELKAQPVFRHTPYRQLFRRRYLGSLLEFLQVGRSICRELLSLPPGTITATDILVSPLTKAREMLGLALWLSRIPVEKRPFVAINFMIDDVTIPRRARGGRFIPIKPEVFYRFAFKRLQKRLAPNRLLLSAGGAAFAHTMTQMLKHSVQLLPLPVQHELPCSPPETFSKQPPLIVYLGHMHKRKGADLVGGIIREVLDKNPDCQFLLQANPECWAKRWQDEIGSKGETRVQIHRGEMSQEEYQHALNRAALVLIPYLPAGYVLQTSGVFSEAMAIGKPSIIPAGTWMADMAHRVDVVKRHFIPRHEVIDISQAVLKALANLTQLTRICVTSAETGEKTWE
ncbi:MAG: glycosyltransferase [Syntrophotaleaceae bacterium]